MWRHRVKWNVSVHSFQSERKIVLKYLFLFTKYINLTPIIPSCEVISVTGCCLVQENFYATELKWYYMYNFISCFKKAHLKYKNFSKEHLSNCFISKRKDMTWHLGMHKHSRALTLGALISMANHPAPSSHSLLQSTPKMLMGKSQRPWMNQHLKSIIKLCSLGLNENFAFFLKLFLKSKSYQRVSSY